LTGSFYVPEGERFVATELTRGPWGTALQHGGPPSALLVRALERRLAEIAPGSQIARVTVEFLRPLPLPVTFAVATEVTRPGKKVQILAAVLRAGETEIARASALAIRSTPLELPPLAARPAPLRSPDESTPFQFPFFQTAVGYHTGFDLRCAGGEWGKGAFALWFRMRHPLVPGETPSPLVRVAIAADSGNGVSVALDTNVFTFINPDLTIYLHRMPQGEWVCLDATTVPQGSGIGLAESGLHDATGPIGRSLQSLVVERRREDRG
jgi:hypothetical protein